MIKYYPVAGVAQLVEQLIRNQQAAGSSPATSSNKPRFTRGFSTILADTLMNCKCQRGTNMTITFGDLKKLCKEKGIPFRGTSLFGASKNDSGKYDCFIEAEDKIYAIKFITLGCDARHVYFNNIGGGYVSVKGEKTTTDFMWAEPKNTPKNESKPTVAVLLLSSDVSATLKSKNSASTVTAGSVAFGCKVYTPSTFVKLF